MRNILESVLALLLVLSVLTGLGVAFIKLLQIAISKVFMIDFSFYRAAWLLVIKILLFDTLISINKSN